jgi:hypothetical protein
MTEGSPRGGAPSLLHAGSVCPMSLSPETGAQSVQFSSDTSGCGQVQALGMAQVGAFCEGDVKAVPMLPPHTQPPLSKNLQTLPE